MRILGAEVHMQAEHACEFEKTASKTWAAFHLKSLQWRTRGSLHAKLRVFHLSVYASFAWASGTRHWTAGGLQRIHANAHDPTGSWVFPLTRRGMGRLCPQVLRLEPHPVATGRDPALGPCHRRLVVALGRTRRQVSRR